MVQDLHRKVVSSLNLVEASNTVNKFPPGENPFIIKMSSNSKSKENQAKFCQGRVSMVEKHFGLLCHTLGSITRKTARLRDKGDLLSKQLLQYAESETISHSSKVGIVHFAESMASIQDYRQAEVQRLDAKVVMPLVAYGKNCKEVKNGIKNEMKALNKERKMAGKLDKVRQKAPGDARQIAESELQKAAQDSNVGSKALDEQILKFESQKLKDLKQILHDFVHVEMVFHAKALEYYSRCFESISHISEDMDLEEFERKLQASRGPGWQAMMLGQSLSSGSGMSSTLASGPLTSPENTGSFGESTTSSVEKRVGFTAQSMYDDDDDDDDDDEDDEYEDEEDLPTRR